MKFRNNAWSKSNNNYHEFKNQNVIKCNNCDIKHSTKRCFYTHPELASEEWQSNKKVEEKIVKKKITDKKGNDKSKKKKDKFKFNITMIYCHHAFDSALNTNALSETFKEITDLMSFVKALINNKITVNKTTTSSSPWKIIIDSEATDHIFFNKNFIFDFKFISFYVETGSDELLWCSGHSKIKINFKDSNSNINVMIKNIIWCSDLNHNPLSIIPFS